MDSLVDGIEVAAIVLCLFPPGDDEHGAGQTHYVSVTRGVALDVAHDRRVRPGDPVIDDRQDPGRHGIVRLRDGVAQNRVLDGEHVPREVHGEVEVDAQVLLKEIHESGHGEGLCQTATSAVASRASA
jgi:hypothetical protein